MVCHCGTEVASRGFNSVYQICAFSQGCSDCGRKHAAGAVQGGEGVDARPAKAVAVALVDEEVTDFGVALVVSAGQKHAGGYLFGQLVGDLVGGEVVRDREEEARLGEVGGDEGGEGSELFEKGLGGAGFLQEGAGG